MRRGAPHRYLPVPERGGAMTEAEGSVQLTIDGGEELVEHRASGRAPLSAAQFDILRMLAEHDVITSTDAGRIVHANRNPPCERCRRGRCGFTSTDGSEALRRLQARGLVRKIAAGLWTARQ